MSRSSMPLTPVSDNMDGSAMNIAGRDSGGTQRELTLDAAAKYNAYNIFDGAAATCQTVSAEGGRTGMNWGATTGSGQCPLPANLPSFVQSPSAAELIAADWGATRSKERYADRMPLVMYPASATQLEGGDSGMMQGCTLVHTPSGGSLAMCNAEDGTLYSNKFELSRGPSSFADFYSNDQIQGDARAVAAGARTTLGCSRSGFGTTCAVSQ